MFFMLGALGLQAQNFLPIKENKKWGFIDTNGRVIIAPQYEQVGELFENTCNVCEGAYCGLLHKDGHFVVPLKFESVQCYSDSIYIVKLNGKYGIYQSEGIEVQFFSGIRRIDGTWSELYLKDDENKTAYIFKNKQLYKTSYLTGLSKLNQFYVGTSDKGEKTISDTKGQEILKIEAEQIQNPYDSIFIISNKKDEALYRFNTKLLDFSAQKITLLKKEQSRFLVVKGVLMGWFLADKKQFEFPVKYLEIKELSFENTLYYALKNKKDQTSILTSTKDTLVSGIESSDYRMIGTNAVCFKENEFYKVQSLKNGLLTTKYNEVSEENNGFYMVSTVDGFGLVNRYGKQVLTPKYVDFQRSGLMLKAVKKDGETDLFEINSKLELSPKNSYKKFTTLHIGEEASKEEADFQNFKFVKAGDSFSKANEEDKKGVEKENFVKRYSMAKAGLFVSLYDDKEKKALTTPLFTHINVDELNRGKKYARVLFQSGRMALLQENGSMIVNREFRLTENSPKTTIKPFSYISSFDENGLAYFSIGMIINRKIKVNPDFYNIDNYKKIGNGGKWGVINDKGEILVQPIYKDISEVSVRGIILQNMSGLYGVLGLKSDTILPFEFTKIETKIEGAKKYYTMYKDHRLWEFFDLNGNAITNADYTEIGRENDGVVCVAKNGKWTAITSEGREICPAIYERAGFYEDGLVQLRSNQKWGAINLQGDTVIDFKYTMLGNYSKGVMSAKLKGRYGLIDIDQNWVAKPVFKKIYENNNGLLIAKKRNLVGVINEKGKWVIKPRFSTINVLNDDYFKVRTIIRDRYKLYSAKGKKISNQSFYKISLVNENGFFEVKKDKKYALVNSNGKTVVNLGKYFDFIDLGDGYLKARKNNFWYLIDTTGKVHLNKRGYALITQTKNGGFFVWEGSNSIGKCVNADGTDFDIENNKSDNKMFTRSPGSLGFASNGSTEILQKLLYTAKLTNRLGTVDHKVFGFAVANKFGMELTDYIFDEFLLFEKQFSALKTRYYLGVYDTDFNPVVEPNFEGVEYLRNHFIKAYRGGAIAYLNTQTMQWIWTIK